VRRDESSLLDIAEAARLVLAFTRDVTKVSFLDDLKTQSAVLHQLLVMGEAVKLNRCFQRNLQTDPAPQRYGPD
jgi:uncharacterized protein with HEPN domain